MIIAVGCDHAGFPLKDQVIQIVRSLKHEVLDCGRWRCSRATIIRIMHWLWPKQCAAARRSGAL